MELTQGIQSFFNDLKMSKQQINSLLFNQLLPF